MKTLKSDIQRALTSWGFIAGIIGMAAVIFFGSFNSILPFLQNSTPNSLLAGFHEQMILVALSSDVMLLCIPILAALPYTSAFVEEYKSRYLKESLPRAGIQPYIVGKMLATGISGGLVLFIGIMLVYIAFALIFTPMEVIPQIPNEAMGNAIAASEGMPQQITQPSMFADIMGRTFVFFLSGFFWSLIGALFATVTMSRYMAYAFPFILYYVLVILCQRYFNSLYILNPQEWVNPTAQWPGGTWGIILFLTELILISSIAYATVIKRRLTDA